VQGFLHTSEVSNALNQTGSALAAISVLKKICDHPALLNSRNALKAVRMPPKRIRDKHRKRGVPSGSLNTPKNRVNAVLGDNSDSEDDFAQPNASSRVRHQVGSSDSDAEDDASLGDFVVDDSDDESASESSDGDFEESEAEEEGGEDTQLQSGGGAHEEGGQTFDNLLQRLKDMHVDDSCKTVRAPSPLSSALSDAFFNQRFYLRLCSCWLVCLCMAVAVWDPEPVCSSPKSPTFVLL
jgi:hypothetical protein